MLGYFRAKRRHNTETLTVHLYGTSISNITPSDNIARPAIGLEGWILEVLGGRSCSGQRRAKRSRAPTEKVIWLVTWLSVLWAQRPWGEVAVHDGLGLRCRTWWASCAPQAHTPEQGIACHSEGSSQHPSDAALTPGSTFLTWERRENVRGQNITTISSACLNSKDYCFNQSY